MDTNKIIVAVQAEGGYEVVGDPETNLPLVFDDTEQATAFLVGKSGLPEQLIEQMFNFVEVTPEQLEEVMGQLA